MHLPHSSFTGYLTRASFSLKQITSTLRIRQFCGSVLPVLSETSIGWSTSQTLSVYTVLMNSNEIWYEEYTISRKKNLQAQ